MTFMKSAFLFLFALLLLSNPLQSQDKRTLDTKIADLLVQVPADNQDQLKQQIKQMLELGKVGLQKVLDMIIPPGTGDDTKPRFAIESLSRYLSQQDMAKEKMMWEAMILEEIENRENTDVKSFLISQLNYMGGDATIQSLGKYIMDDKLYDPAIRAMRDANPEAAAKVFADHLNRTHDNAQIALISALGEIGIEEYAAAVAKLAGGTHPELQKSVLASLARLGHPDSYAILVDAAKTAEYLYEPTNATGSLLAYAQTLSEKEKHELSLKICKSLQKKCSGPEQMQFKIHALIIAAGNTDIEDSAPLLVDALKSNEKQYRMAAINYAAKLKSPVDPWIAALNSAKSSEVKSEVLYLLGQLADPESVEVIKVYLTNNEAMVRQQAVKSLALIQKESAINDILNYTLTYPSPPDTKTATEVLLQTVEMEQVQLLADKLNAAPDGSKVVLIEVIAAKGNSDYFNLLLDQLKQGGQVRTSALENLYKVASSDQLSALLELYDQLEEEEEMMHIEKAIIASVSQSEDRSRATEAVLTHALEKSSVEKYIGVLGSLGGKEAMRTIFEAYKKGDEITKERAFNALIKSTGIEAIAALFDICSGDNPVSEKESALRSFVRIVRGSDQAADQKLLLLRKVEPYASDMNDRKEIIRAMGDVKSFLSLVCLSKYLDDDLLQDDAANALVGVVLPSSGLENGLTGKMVKDKLVKARDIITGPDTEYLKIDIENYLEKMPDQTGYVSMFNGKDLKGWQGLATDPVQKQKLPTEELQKLQDKADEILLENWSVKDNCIVFNGKGANLCSIKQYGSFEMLVDWRITKKGDSGIYLRGSPQVQIWDTSRVESGAQVGSGGLYNNQIHESKPLMVADNPIGDWNTFRITMIDERVTVHLNGQLVVDNVVMENYWDRSIPIFPMGSIELQAHGTDLAFRDIYVKELDGSAYMLTEEEKANGYEVLFNGMDLSGWTGNNHTYKVEEGNIVIRPQEGGGNLFTGKEYSDFIFRFEFKLTPGANNGLGIRAPLEGDAAYVGYELQILDNTAPVYADLMPYQYHGSVYGIIPAKRGFLKPVGEWNSQEVMVKGDDIKITLNGTNILEGNIKEATKNGTADGKDHPGLKRTTGHIGFLGHGSLLWFRNIRIKELNE